METSDREEVFYEVVKNIEEQFSIWPEDRSVPEGWHKAGFKGEKERCLDFIQEVWTDMRPLSLRKHMDSVQPFSVQGEEIVFPEISPTVVYLSTSKHPVSVAPFVTNQKQLLEALEARFIHITFTDTQGETCLGLPVDPDNTDTSGADFSKGTGTVHFEGELSIDFVRVRCIVDVDLASLEGEGFLKKIQ